MPKPRKAQVSLDATPITIAFPAVSAEPFFAVKIPIPVKASNTAINGSRSE